MPKFICMTNACNYMTLIYRQCLVLLLLLSVLPAAAQSIADCSLLTTGTFQVCDNFTDGNFTDTPPWGGDAIDFTIDAQQLRTNATSSSPIQLTTPMALNMSDADVQWEFFARLRFNTSSNNYADVYLSSNADDLKNGANGYFVRIGGTPDEVSLWRKDGTAAPVQLIDGVDGLTVTTNNLLRIKVTRTIAGEWTLQRDFGLTGLYFTEGTATDMTYTFGTQFGFLINYTASNSANFNFDDIYIGNPIVDNTPPDITDVFATSDTTVTVVYSENVLSASAQNTDNYLLNGSDNPTSAVLTSGTTVTLTFAAPFISGQNNALQVSNVQDFSGNTLTTVVVNFVYYGIQQGDVLINEIFADPTPQVGLPDAEFIELYNQTGFAINLLDWGFTKTYPNIEFTLPAITLPPNGYLILCAASNATLYEPFGQTLGIFSSSTYLTNSGSNLSLVSPTGMIVDQVNYSDAWYGSTQKKEGGWSLERIDPNNPCNGSNNWTASIHPQGGTPGTVNSVTGVLIDTTAPQIVSYSLVNSSVIEIVFSEPVIGDEFLNPANYTLSGGISVVSVLEDVQAITLLLNTNITVGILYTLLISQLQDCSGNIAEGLQIQFGLGQEADPFDVLMNEIYADTDPPIQYQSPNLTMPKVRFVELYNRSNKVIDLAQWQFSDATATATLSPYLLLPNAYVVLCSTTQTAELTAIGVPTIGVTSFPTLNVTGDDLLLVNGNGTTIHGVNYLKSWYLDAVKAEGGYTLELIDPNNPCEGAANWRASNALSGGTPGMQNSIFGSNPDTAMPDLLRAEAVTPTTVLLYFNETLDTQSATDASQYTINNGIGNPVSAIVPLNDFKAVALNLSSALQENTVYTITIGDALTDCAGNAVAALYRQASFGLARTATPNDVVINEILFNPITGGSDYVELFNPTNDIISLNNWYIANTEIGVPDTLTNHVLITTEPFSLLPNAYVVLTPSTSNILQLYGNCTTPLHASKFIQVALPTLPDDEGTVAITDLLSTVVIDRVDYSEDWHNEVIDFKDGTALERVAFNAPSNSPYNWQSAATICYGTPSYANSQTAQPGFSDQTFTITPPSFSPDDDGNDDFTLISYQLSDPGYVVNITIYDERGREVRRLVQNEILGTQGFYKWNGNTDGAEKASLGIYVVYIELFNLKGDVQKIKKTCVVGGRLNE